ncbi:RagB/SusD family nutrient uptake outer membrane protein [Chitinophaga silvatica]|nr:RagB/SusD family nutrient uptake outer membrane protein [Chitinophaga silvatica]
MKKMRLLFNIGMVGCMLTLGSCEKQIFKEPYAYLSPADAFSTPDKISKAATGMYDQLQNANFFGGRVLVYADIRGIDAGVPAYFGDVPKFNTLLSTNSYVNDAWRGAYRTIYEVNVFLKNLAANPGKVSDAQAAQYTAEGKFIRSLVYFYLVNLWAQPYKFTSGASHLGVPLILTASDDPFSASNQVPRNTVAEVYNQIEKDLLEAEAALNYPNNTRAFADVARATKGAAQGLLMRLYLYKGDYQKALDYANKLITSGKYAMNTDGPATAFRNFTTNESIFSVGMSGGDNPNTNNALGQHYSPDGRGDIAISPDYVNLMEATDKRRTDLVRTYAPAPGTLWSTKYVGVADWVPVLRYSEVLLTKAEALANLNTAVDADAVALVNLVRSRSNATPIAAPATKQGLINAVILERRIELAFEGQGILDFLRTGRNIPAHATVNEQAYGSDYVVFPIPKYETDMNLKLDQNHGY